MSLMVVLVDLGVAVLLALSLCPPPSLLVFDIYSSLAARSVIKVTIVRLVQFTNTKTIVKSILRLDSDY